MFLLGMLVFSSLTRTRTISLLNHFRRYGLMTALKSVHQANKKHVLLEVILLRKKITQQITK